MSLPPAPTRGQILRFEGELRRLPQVDAPTHHTFAPGLYIRTIELAAGTTLTGMVHKTEHVFLLTKGILTVVTEDGRQTLEAPAQFVARAGLKRVGYCHTDVVCSNVHITTETDLARLEADLVEPPEVLSYEAMEALS